jgi:crotonobetainyl-CoA:carnitine CoA-transferase CaiB-like acyl-CoA transferase
VKILDLSRVLAGPFATQRLADLGADVVKVERPGSGDETREWGPPWQPDGAASSYFISVNRGKRSLALDMASVDGREIVRSLAAEADVLIHNLRTDSAEKMGLGVERLRSANPDLILCRITGFGDSREPQSRPGYDLVVQAESGLMALTGPVNGEPHKVGVAMVDVLTGLEASTAILAALVGRGAGQGGCDIEVPLLDAAISALVNVAQGAIASGSTPTRWGNAHPSIVPYQPFEASDGYVVVAVTNDPQWRSLCEVLGGPDLAGDRRFISNPERVANRDKLVPLLNNVFRTRKASEWVSSLSAAGIPCGVVMTVDEAFAAASEAGSPLTVDLAGGTRAVAPPQRFDGQRQFSSVEPPRLGEHTDEVLTELGFDQARIAQLREQGVVG